MSRSCSLTAKPVILERYEIEALIDWHRDQQYRCAEKEEYAEANDHKHRTEQLRDQLEVEMAKP
jgi:hypothetical protein